MVVKKVFDENRKLVWAYFTNFNKDFEKVNLLYQNNLIDLVMERAPYLLLEMIESGIGSGMDFYYNLTEAVQAKGPVNYRLDFENGVFEIEELEDRVEFDPLHFFLSYLRILPEEKERLKRFYTKEEDLEEEDKGASVDEE